MSRKFCKISLGSNGKTVTLKGIIKYIAVILVFALAACSCGESDNHAKSGAPAVNKKTPIRFKGETAMGPYHVTVLRALSSEDERSKLDGAIHGAVEAVTRSLSLYRPDSEVSRFNDSLSTEPFPVSEDTFNVAAESIETAKASGGAFDPTVRPLVELWGFGKSRPSDAPPAESELKKAAAQVDYRKIELDAQKRTIRKLKKEITLDLNAVADGYAADKVSRLLTASGYSDFLVEVAGEVRAAGKNQDGRPWRVGIDKPRYGTAEGEDLQIVIGLSDMSLSTSGDYHNYRDVGGRRVSHTIDPALRGPIAHNLASVTVIMRECAAADGLSTALEVLGAEKGMQLIEKLKSEKMEIEAYMILRKTDGTFETTMTDGFSRMMLRDSKTK
jgi:FAD:protein FMN transferase